MSGFGAWSHFENNVSYLFAAFHVTESLDDLVHGMRSIHERAELPLLHVLLHQEDTGFAVRRKGEDHAPAAEEGGEESEEDILGHPTRLRGNVGSLRLEQVPALPEGALAHGVEDKSIATGRLREVLPLVVDDRIGPQ